MIKYLNYQKNIRFRLIILIVIGLAEFYSADCKIGKIKSIKYQL